jgi:hypothetical protein
MKKEVAEEVELKEKQLTQLVEKLADIAEGSANRIYTTIKGLSDDLIERDDMDEPRKAILRLLRDFARMNDQMNDATVKTIVANVEEEVKI